MASDKLNEIEKMYNELKENGWHSCDIELARQFLEKVREFYKAYKDRAPEDKLVRACLDPKVTFGIKSSGTFTAGSPASPTNQGPKKLVLEGISIVEEEPLEDSDISSRFERVISHLKLLDKLGS